ncbi:MAG: TonB-dependent receptor [Rhodothermales bacterium]
MEIDVGGMARGGWKGILSVALMMGWCVTTAWAQSQSADSLMSYELNEIVVGGGFEEAKVATTPQLVRRIGLADLARMDAAAIDEVARLIPSAHVQTNSRGETLVYLRGAGERQVALFLDGALLNIPWDNRVDLSLIPTSAIGGLSVAKGVSSVVYGTNTLGGAVNLTSRSLGYTGSLTEITSGLGTDGRVQGSLIQAGRRGGWSYLAALGGEHQDGVSIPDAAEVPFSQPDPDQRTNSQRTLLNAFASVRYQDDERIDGGLTLIHVDGEKGVPPESHLDPSVENVRYWQYPLWQYTTLIGHTRYFFSPRTNLRTSVWGTRFVQHIAQYGSVDYTSIDAQQEDLDWTGGARAVLTHRQGLHTLRGAMNLLASQHDQADVTEGVAAPAQTYAQRIMSFGAEYEYAAGDLSATLGTSYDGVTTPKTGDKPPQPDTWTPSLTSGLSYRLTDRFAVRTALGRKVRFPTMRELFGEALNRFLINPDLKPETAWIGEAGLLFESAVASGEVTVFVNRVYDTIDRRNVTVDGNRLRQRINLDGSRVVGLEVAGAIAPLAGLRLDGHATYLHLEAYTDEGTTRIVEKPELLATITSTYTGLSGWTLTAQGIATGRAWGLGEDNAFIALPRALRLNLRVGRRVQVGGVYAEVYARADNITDALVLPQLGLPAPGRALMGGVNVSF